MKNFINKKNIGAGAVLSSLFVASVMMMPVSPSGKETTAETLPVYTNLLTKEVERSTKTELQNPFEKIKIEAHAAIVWDIKNQETIFELNADEVLPLASITKMFTAVTAYELLHPNTEIIIEKDFLEAEGDTGLYLGERWNAKDLIDFSLITSSNDGARALASIAGSISAGLNDYELGKKMFIEKINEKARSYHLETMRIENESGLDEDEERAGAYGSARELAIFFEKLLKDYPEILESTALIESDFTSLSGINHRVKNTNISMDRIPGLIGSKTGFTTLAGGNLAIIFDADLGRPIVVVVLGSTYNERFGDVDKLIKATRSFLTSNQ